MNVCSTTLAAALKIGIACTLHCNTNPKAEIVCSASCPKAAVTYVCKWDAADGAGVPSISGLRRLDPMP